MTGTDESLGLQDLSPEDAPSDPAPVVPAMTTTRTPAQLAVQAGWIMATLYDNILVPPPDEVLRLPNDHQLQPIERKELELGRLGRLLQILAALPECSGSGLPTDVSKVDVNGQDFRTDVIALNIGILKALAIAEPETLIAYKLGLSLRTTVWRQSQNMVSQWELCLPGS